MSDKEQNKWKRKVPTRIYDYNYKVGESYYNPQTEFIENREFLTTRKAPPPEAQTYAERFASRPFYGKAYGLPYGEEEAQRAHRRRAASAGRASRASRESDDIPLSTPRAGRSRDRKLSFNDDDFDLDVRKALKGLSLGADDLPRRSKFSLDDETDFQVPVRRASAVLDRDLAEEFAIRPENKSELMKKFKALEREFKKADEMERGTTSRKSEHSAWSDELGLPGKRSVKRDEVSYTDPATGAKVHKSSFQESSKFESSSTSSSKPPHLPRPPRPSRLVSVDSDLDFKVPSRPRSRRISLGDVSGDDMDIRGLASKALSHIRDAGSDFESKKFRGAREIRDQRRAKESDELTANINKMISKMKKHDEGADEIKVSRTFRSSSLEPLRRETIVKASPTHRFVYGVSRF